MVTFVKSSLLPPEGLTKELLLFSTLCPQCFHHVSTQWPEPHLILGLSPAWLSGLLKCHSLHKTYSDLSHSHSSPLHLLYSNNHLLHNYTIDFCCFFIACLLTRMRASRGQGFLLGLVTGIQNGACTGQAFQYSKSVEGISRNDLHMTSLSSYYSSLTHSSGHQKL